MTSQMHENHHPYHLSTLVLSTIFLFVGAASAGIVQRADRITIASSGAGVGAVCNDGNQADYFYRPSPSPLPSNKRKWIIILDGGGVCGSEEGCFNRWFATIPQPGNGYHDDMIPSRQPSMNFFAKGILNEDQPANAFANFNKIYVHYCSSDHFSGMGSVRSVPGIQFATSAQNPGGYPQPANLVFAGAKIVDAVVAAVMNGKVEGGGAGVADTSMIPDPVNGEIAFVGQSGGAYGVIHGLDRVRDNANLPPGRVYGIIDSADEVGLASLGMNSAFATAYGFWKGDVKVVAPVSDQDCLDRYSPANSQYGCFNSGANVLGYAGTITTPHFVASNAYDPLIHSYYLEGGAFSQATSGAFRGYSLQEVIDRVTGASVIYLSDALGLFIPAWNISPVPNAETDGVHVLSGTDNHFFASEADHGGYPTGPQFRSPADPNDTSSMATATAAFRICSLQPATCSTNLAARRLVNVRGTRLYWPRRRSVRP